MSRLKSEWRGPFSIVPVKANCWLAEDREALRPGVYLWVADVGDEYRVNYVGMSTNSITARTLEHLSRSFGVNTIEFAENYRRGVRGDSLFCRSEHDWGHKREKILPELIEYLTEIRIVFAPIDTIGLPKYGKTELERIESALIDHVREYESDDSKTPFLTNNRRSRVVLKDQRDIEVELSQSALRASIGGVPPSFSA